MDSDANERKARLLVELPPQMRGCLGENDLQRRPDMRLQEVPAVRRAVSAPDDHMGVDLRLTILQRHVADKRERLDLLVQRDAAVVLALPVEEAQRDVAEGTVGG